MSELWIYYIICPGVNLSRTSDINAILRRMTQLYCYYGLYSYTVIMITTITTHSTSSFVFMNSTFIMILYPKVPTKHLMMITTSHSTNGNVTA
jgi:hypothetical protein